MQTAKSIKYELWDGITFLKKDVIEIILCWKTGKWFQSKNVTWLLKYSSIYYSIEFFSLLKDSLTFLIQIILMSGECVVV